MLTSREKALKIFNLRGEEGVMWTGHPSGGAIQNFSKEWSIEPDSEAVFNYLNDDCRWIGADYCYRHPLGLPAFDPAYGTEGRKSLSAEGCFADAETISDIEKYPWPDASYCDFTELYTHLEGFSDKMVFTGMWSPFFHLAADFFGMENYFVYMYERPEVVLAATERIVDFYVEANEKFFAGLGDRADVFFFGNDFGTQRGLFFSTEQFKKFVLPSFKRLINVGKKYGKKVMLHSCGSINAIIPLLIEAGVDALHPLQAAATDMDAKTLSQYKNDIAFVGGIDAQTFFVNATPEEIKAEVRRVKSILGPNIIVSPSHEEILPNIPPANILAMAQAAKE